MHFMTLSLRRLWKMAQVNKLSFCLPSQSKKVCSIWDASAAAKYQAFKDNFFDHKKKRLFCSELLFPSALQLPHSVKMSKLKVIGYSSLSK